MDDQTADFTLAVAGVRGSCPAGERYAAQQIAAGATPVLSCEGPCIRGDIARRAADLVARQPSLARACHGEAFFVPHSSMAAWVGDADRVVVIDGCFLACHARALQSIVAPDRITRIDALPLYRKYTDVMLADDVPEDERKQVAEDVAGKIVALLERGDAPACGCGSAGCA
jgi:uncharacterized metal-binding protein